MTFEDKTKPMPRVWHEWLTNLGPKEFPLSFNEKEDAENLFEQISAEQN